MPASQTVTLSLAAGWNTFPLGNFGAGTEVGYIAVQSDAGATLDVIAVGAFDEFSDETLPQRCGFYATGVSVGADAVGPGYSFTATRPGVVGSGDSTGSLGIKSAGVATVTVTVTGPS